MKAGTIGMWFWGGLALSSLFLALVPGTLGWMCGAMAAVFALPWAYSYGIYQQSGLLEGLKASGFTFDYVVGKGDKVVIDKKQRKLAVVSAKKIREYRFEDVNSWEWSWKDVNGTRKENVLAIDIRDESFPLLKVQFGDGADEAQQWNSRLGLVLKGG